MNNLATEMVGVTVDVGRAAPDSVTRRVREFITTNFYIPDSTRLGDGTSLLDSGVIDSTGVLEVVAFLESAFQIQVEDADLVPENLDSIEKIRAYIKKRGGDAHEQEAR